MPWSDITITSDEAIRRIDSRMPEMAKRERPVSHTTPYEGKRLQAKLEMVWRIIALGVDLFKWTEEQEFAIETVEVNGQQVITNTFLDPYVRSIVEQYAAMKELELYYRDMGDKNDSVSIDKANYYAKKAEEVWPVVLIRLGVPTSESQIGFIRAGRA